MHRKKKQPPASAFGLRHFVPGYSFFRGQASGRPLAPFLWLALLRISLLLSLHCLPIPCRWGSMHAFTLLLSSVIVVCGVRLRRYHDYEDYNYSVWVGPRQMGPSNHHHAVPISNPQPSTRAAASFGTMLAGLVLAPERGHAILLLRVVRDLPGVAGLHLERGTDCGGSKAIKFRFWVVIVAEGAGLLQGSSADHRPG